jgi:hypothetical protein
MKMRSDADKISMAPVKVRLGDTDYKLPVLRTLKMREWREKLNTSLGPTLATFGLTVPEVGAEDAVQDGIVAVLLTVPEKITELMFEFCPELPRETVLNESTEEQMVAAFLEVLQVAYPFLAAVAMMKAIVTKELSPFQKPVSSRLQ